MCFKTNLAHMTCTGTPQTRQGSACGRGHWDHSLPRLFFCTLASRLHDYSLQRAKAKEAVVDAPFEVGTLPMLSGLRMKWLGEGWLQASH